MNTSIEQWFGRTAPEGTETVVAWGARAIWQGDGLDIVFNRQQMDWDKGTQEQRQAFADWLRDVGIPAVETWIKTSGVSTGSREIFTHIDEEQGYTIEACPNASFGYMYMGAWKPAPEPEQV